MSESKNYGLLISALVAMVAIVGLVVLLRGNTAGAVTVIRGGAEDSFGRPLGNRGSGLLGEDQPCWYNADGELVCPSIGKGGPDTFGAPIEYREGAVPTQIHTASGRGFYSS